eukprot:SAG22_NODE_7600_length_725_cov_1.321086_2_plen_47_part_00
MGQVVDGFLGHTKVWSIPPVGCGAPDRLELKLPADHSDKTRSKDTV